jgi:tetratricopeptide (TPR) repeat protein
MTHCPSCGREPATGAAICDHCGHETDSSEKDPAEPDVRRRTPTALWFVLGSGVVVVIAMVLALMRGRISISTTPSSAPPPTARIASVPTRNTSAFLDPAVSRVMTSPRVYDHDSLIELDEARWYFSDAAVTVADEKLAVTGDQPWATWWGTVRTFKEGDAVLVLFQPGVGSQFEFHFERGDWATPDYRRWAFHGSTRFEMSIWEGANPQRWGELVGQLSPDPQAWYYLLLGMDLDGEFVAFAWEQGEATPQIAYRRRLDESWSGPGWVFGMGANRGKLFIDEVTEITFADVRDAGRADEHFWDALVLIDQQDPSGALDKLDAAIRPDPDQPVYLYYRGMTLWRMGRLEGALADLTRASTLDPNNDAYCRQLAWFYARELNDADQARTYMERALSLAPLEARNYRLRALILRDTQDSAQAALADFSQAIELSPLEAELYRLRGETYNLLGDYAAGLQDGIECAERQPEDAACYLQQARSYVGLDDEAGAVTAYKRFLDTTDDIICLGCREEALTYIAGVDE